MLNPTEHPHRRYNALTGEWLLVSPHRAKRPWQGQIDTTPTDTRPAYDPNCYLCPGNSRSGGNTNPQYSGTFVFDNDFQALMPDTPSGELSDHPLFRIQGERGTCRVMCYTPRHDLTLAQMDVADVRTVIDMWADQTLDLGSRPYVGYVQIFENRGAMMGQSSPHPHGQVWATEHVPLEAAKELNNQRAYYAGHGVTLLSDYLEEERQRGERIVYANEHWTVLVPFWAIWPFETMLVCNRPARSLPELDAAERDALAETLHQLGVRYDNLFRTSFPYSMGFHQQPTDGEEHPYWHVHAHFYPPLLRSSTIRKFMVGFELLGMPQRDITPEQAAARLRDQSDIHYLKA